MLAWVIVTLFICPTLNLFDRRAQNFWGRVVLIGNIILSVACMCLLYLRDDKLLTLNATDIRNSMLVGTTILTIYVFFMIYINDVCSQVYEDVHRSNEAVEAAARDKEQFYATMSHEIRNPLQSLQGSVDLATELLRVGSSAQLTQDLPPLLDICRGCCGIVINLVSNILDISKIAADKMQFSPVPTDLRELVNRILKISKGRAEGKSIALDLECDSWFPPAIEIDPQRVEQILVNLVSNAIKFTPTKGRIVVKVSWLPLIGSTNADNIRLALIASSWKHVMEFEERPEEARLAPSVSSVQDGSRSRRCTIGQMPRRVAGDDDRSGFISAHPPNSADPSPSLGQEHNRAQTREGIAKIEVMDSGIGIEKSSIARLFKAYQQADSSISRYAPGAFLTLRRKYGGTGLGLWISKNILRNMQGDIRVKSKLGKGSDFIVAFPARVAEEVAAIANTGDEDVPGADALQGKSYLLLDDIAENTFIVAAALKRYGVRSTIRQNGAEALETYKAAPATFDGIITDLRMPLMSGQTFIQEIRRLERESGRRESKVPIIVITAESAMEEKRLCLTQYGATEYLLKPTKLRDLVSVLVRIHSPTQGNRARRARSILILDDDMVGSQFLKVALTKAGHRCKQAFSVGEGIGLIRETRYDIVLLDSLLGDGTGMDFLRGCRDVLAGTGDGGRGRIRVVSMSGNDVGMQRRMYESARGNVEMVIDGYLQKPVRRQELIELIQVL